MQTSQAPSARQRWFDVLERPESGRTARVLQEALMVLIALNVLGVLLETVPSIYQPAAPLFDWFDTFSVAVFTLEYAARIWASPQASPDQPPGKVRLRYLRSPMAITDLLAIALFHISSVIGIDLRVLRSLRLLRPFKLTRYTSAMSILLEVLREEASSLLAALCILSVLLVLASSGAYLAEHDAQPEAFGSIPEAMWWAMATLTTVGYGDVTPITALGRIFGGLVAVVGVGMAALPTVRARVQPRRTCGQHVAGGYRRRHTNASHAISKARVPATGPNRSTAHRRRRPIPARRQVQSCHGSPAVPQQAWQLRVPRGARRGRPADVGTDGLFGR